MRNLFTSLLFLFICGNAYADVVSLDANYVQGQTDVVGKLNRDRTALTNGVNNIRGVYVGSVQSSGQIKAATVGDENLYSDASPRVYLDDLFINNKMDTANNGIVATGLEFGTSSNLIANASPGVGYTRGYRIEKTDSTPHSFTASKWTYTFLCQDGSFSYLERTIGTAITPSDYPTNCQPLSRVSTDSTAVTDVTDLRKTKFTLSSYDSVYDNSLESSLKNLLVANGNSYRVGANLNYTDASSYTVTAGAAMINSDARDRAAFVSDASWPVAIAADNDGLDTGTRTTGTYYVYLVSDEQDTRTYRVVHSLNPSNPNGKTNYLKIGEFYSNTGTISKDSVTTYVNGEKLLTKQQLIKGKVNFNGSTMSIRSSYNVSSITDNGVGDYTINWATAFDDDTYTAAGICNGVGLPDFRHIRIISQTAGALRITSGSVPSGNEDESIITVIAA